MNQYKTILYVEDLFNFCEEHNLTSFKSEETGYQLAVHVPANFSEESDNSDPLLFFGYVKAFHIGKNRNGSSVTKEAAEKSLDYMAYKPVLADFCEFDGEKDFTSHAIEVDSDGNKTYIEHQVGCVTADKPYIAFDEEEQKDFVFLKVAIPREYTDTCSIIERKGGTKVSVELLVNELSYSAKEKALLLTDISLKGVTLLGRNPETGKEIKEGMKGACLSIEDFSAQNNSTITENYTINTKLIETLEKLSAKLDDVSFSDSHKTDLSIKGGENKNMKFTELLEKYQVTEADVDFDFDGLSDEELENKFEEKFGKQAEPQEPEFTQNPEPVTVNKYSITMSDGTVKEYALSLSDIQNALYNLVNATYGEADDTWYSVSVYEDNTLIMFDWWNNKAFKQSYSKEEENFLLTGDRVEVFQNWLTAAEEESLKEMRENYSLLQEKVDSYELNEARQKKSEILNQEKYSILSESQDFQALKENMDKYSLEELTKEVKAIHSDYVSEHPEVFSFSQLEPKPRKTVAYGISFDAKKKPYGNLFK